MAAVLISRVGPRKIRVSNIGVRCFNALWPCSTLRDTRAYWFEFDSAGNLIDTDCPEQDDGLAASAMADDCREYLVNHKTPQWAE